jgi:hypothetical protein
LLLFAICCNKFQVEKIKDKVSIMKIPIVFILASILLSRGYSQEKSKKEIKEEQRIEKQQQIDSLVYSKEFVFTALTALPQGYRSVNLSSNPNYVKFHPDLIDSDMPYFGRAYGAAGYGGDAGLKFKGKPDEFTVTKNKKDYQVNAIVKGENDVYRISLSVSFEGSSTLSIRSNNRNSISYYGEILPPEKKEENK